MTRPILPSSLELLTEVYRRAGSVMTGKGKYTTINELTDQIPAVRPIVLAAAFDALINVAPIPEAATLVLSEEDKGAILAGLFSFTIGLPLAMARHNVTYHIPGALSVPLSMEYMDGTLEIHGISAGDRVLLIDDTLASGGTIISLINAIREAGADVIDIRVIVEKIGYGGRLKVLEATDIPVHAAMGIAITSDGKVYVPDQP